MIKLISVVLLVVVLEGCANYDWQFNKHYTQSEINNA